jgi:hypothetical protein
MGMAHIHQLDAGCYFNVSLLHLHNILHGSADADYVGLREGFTRLARLIDTYAAIKVGCGVAATAGCWLRDVGLGKKAFT